MNHLRFALVLLGIFVLTYSNAQKPPMKWGQVDLEELNMTTCPEDTTAAAVILGDYATLKFDFGQGTRYIFEHHRRIKILDKSAFNYGDVQLYLYGDDQISGLKAQTISRGSGQTFRLKGRDFYEEEVADEVKALKFTFPNLEEGAVIEYTYTITSDRIVQLRSWYYQHDIPVRWSELHIDIPVWFEYLFLTNGRSPDINEQERLTQNFRVVQYKTKQAGMSGTVKQASGTTTMSGEVTRYRLVMENVPALKEEAFITTMDDYRASLRFQLQAVRFPNQPVDQILSSWPDVAKRLLTSTAFGLQFDKKRNQKELLEALAPYLPEQGTPSEKALAAYYYLQDALEWDGSYWYNAEESVLECFDRKRGSSGELNLILMTVLKALDVECYPVLLSTRSHGKMLQLYPIVRQFNHMVTVARINDQLLILDLSDDERPAGVPRKASLNKVGWLVSETNPQWINIAPPGASTARMFQMSLSENGDLSYQLQTKSEGYHAVDIRDLVSGAEGEQALAKELQKHFPESQAEGMQVALPDNPVDAVKWGYTAQVPGAAQAFNDFIYFSPCILPYFEENPFQKAERSYPVDLAHPFDVRDVFIVEIPEGYVLEEMPESASFALPGKAGRFEFTPTETTGKVNLVYSLRLDKTHFEPEEYLALKQFLDLVIEKQGEQFVFRKKT